MKILITITDDNDEQIWRAEAFSVENAIEHLGAFERNYKPSETDTDADEEERVY